MTVATKEMVDPSTLPTGVRTPPVEQAGWHLRDHAKVKVKIEITACPDAFFGVDGYDAEPWRGVSDYCLYREYGAVLTAARRDTASETVMKLI